MMASHHIYTRWGVLFGSILINVAMYLEQMLSGIEIGRLPELILSSAPLSTL